VSFRSNRLFGLAVVASLAGGCVERRMTITSDPPGALVYLNNEEVGRTPIERDFTWYGNYDVVVRKEGYETLKTSRQVSAPWWQWPPIDLLAEMMPWHPTDRQSLQFSLKPATPLDAPPEQLIDRAGQLREQLQGSQAQPATRP
jgi:hypothetical protein